MSRKNASQYLAAAKNAADRNDISGTSKHVKAAIAEDPSLLDSFTQHLIATNGKNR